MRCRPRAGMHDGEKTVRLLRTVFLWGNWIWRLVHLSAARCVRFPFPCHADNAGVAGWYGAEQVRNARARCCDGFSGSVAGARGRANGKANGKTNEKRPGRRCDRVVKGSPARFPHGLIGIRPDGVAKRGGLLPGGQLRPVLGCWKLACL